MGLTDRHVEVVRKGARVSRGLSTRNQHPRLLSFHSPTTLVPMLPCLFFAYSIPTFFLLLRLSLPLSISLSVALFLSFSLSLSSSSSLSVSFSFSFSAFSSYATCILNDSLSFSSSFFFTIPIS